MTGTRGMGLVVYSAGLLAVTSWLWYSLTPNYSWHMVQQFWGHLGPAAFLVAMGASAMYLRGRMQILISTEAWLAIAAGGVYILADTFIMHPPWGIFDGAGHSEQEHVALMGLILALGVSALILQRRMGARFSPTIHFVIGAAAAGMVFMNHHQHTVAGTVGHNATLVMLLVAVVFRMMGNLVEYGMAMIVTGFVFFCSQMGFAMYVDMSGNSAGAWVAGWAMGGFLAATGYLAMAPHGEVPAE